MASPPSNPVSDVTIVKEGTTLALSHDSIDEEGSREHGVTFDSILLKCAFKIRLT